MNTDIGGKRHHQLQLAIPRFRIRGDRGTAPIAPPERRTRALIRRTNNSKMSSTGVLLWKLISRGTEPGHAHGLLTAWPGWEHISEHMWPTTQIPNAPYGILRMRIAPYRGEPLTLPDGTEIGEGSVVGEIHCNNPRLLEVASSGATNPFAASREDLRSLAQWVRDDEVGRQVIAFYGVTLLVKGAARLGFTIRERPINIRRRFERVFMSGLLLLYTPDGVERLSKGTTPKSYPQEIWISRRELIRRYGDRPGRLLNERRTRESRPRA